MFPEGDGMRKKNTVFKKISDEVKTICNFHCKCHQNDRISNIFLFLNFVLRNTSFVCFPKRNKLLLNQKVGSESYTVQKNCFV